MSGQRDARTNEIIHHDVDGKRYVLDEAGNRRPPMQSERDSEPGEFATYDSSQGHCGLCGSLTCNGGCFK